MNRRVWVGILLTVLAIGALGVVGAIAFDVGWERGVVAGSEASGIDAGAVDQVGRGHPSFGPGGHRGGYGYWGFAPFGFIGPLFGLLFFFLLFGLIARLFWGRRGPWHYGPGPGHYGPWEERLADWHRRAHSGPEESDATPGKS